MQKRKAESFMSATVVEPITELPPFHNEPYTDFARPANAEAARRALAVVQAQLGTEYDLLIAGERRKSKEKLRSLNPARPKEVVGVHQQGTPKDAADAVERAFAFFPEWADTPIEKRVYMLVRLAETIRVRKLEFDAWLVLEAGKTWPEAEADVSEAIDFCEYYARQALRMSRPDPLVQLSGERAEMQYLPLGVGIIIPPWNFPLAILLGMTTAALVTGNTFVIKP
jgi:1-pyrroline-5-carboxylate dehydrogenase